MDKLGLDLIRLVLVDHLSDGRNASRVCSEWRGICGPMQFRHLIVKQSHMVETAECFLNHPYLLAQTRDVTFLDLKKLSPDDVRKATNALGAILPRRKLERFTLRRCRSPEILSFDASFILLFDKLYFIDSVIPPCAASALPRRDWKQVHFCDAQWSPGVQGVRQSTRTLRALRTETLWVEPWVEFNSCTEEAKLIPLMSSLMATADCLTLVGPNFSYSSPSDQDAFAWMSPTVRHLSIASTCCYSFEGGSCWLDWTGFDLCRMGSLSSLWVVAESQELQALKNTVLRGISASLVSVHFELHPDEDDLDGVQSLQRAIASHTQLQSVVFNVCLCRAGHEPLDHDESTGLPFIDPEAASRVARQEELWRQKGASFNFVRTDETLQGLSHAGQERWVHGQDSCMVCTGGYHVPLS
ncbi:hypothetical protein CYLTODRAFT_494887 [Cylindrobasidium torrendii FP15055 ss-10]|uniref:F-box domain-containing protein n=1 Tax=Cylindrobasidium torrendii FP15055 ss-10 TaxID=1314674 RepID=A0A0D7AW47_9AGAR|nr:hypothetical protein CYLTODRAFT_494887 [Cylindrobasidium torrendii FP15055 ss-10]